MEVAEKGVGRASYGISFTSILPALLITLSSAVIASAASLAAPASGKVGVIFSPGLSGEEATQRVVAAGGLPVDIGTFDNIVVAWVENPTFGERIEEEGAWLTFDPLGLGGCLRPLL